MGVASFAIWSCLNGGSVFKCLNSFCFVWLPVGIYIAYYARRFMADRVIEKSMMGSHVTMRGIVLQTPGCRIHLELKKGGGNRETKNHAEYVGCPS